MRNILFILLFISSIVNAQDTLQVPCKTKINVIDTIYTNSFDTLPQSVLSITGHLAIRPREERNPRQGKFKYYIQYDTVYSAEQVIKIIDTSYFIHTETVTGWCDSIIPTVISIKPQLTGNATRQADWLDTNRIDLTYMKNVGVIVLKVDWATLQPSQNVIDTKYIDAWLSWAERFNKANKLNVRFKLRIVPGVAAPDFVKKAVGTFVLSGIGYETVAGLQDRDSNCVKFWEPVYMAYWDNFQRLLAARYDGNDLIAEVVNSATSTATGESLIRAVSNAGGGLIRKNSYLAAGYTIDKDYAAVLASIEVMAKYWHRTNVGMAITVWETIDGNRVGKDINRSKAIAEYLCKTFGSRSVIGNNGLGTPGWEPGGEDYNLGQYFISLKQQYGASIYYQTAAPASIISSLNGVKGVLDLGLSMRASLVELPQPPQTLLKTLSTNDLLLYNNRYQSNSTYQ